MASISIAGIRENYPSMTDREAAAAIASEDHLSSLSCDISSLVMGSTVILASATHVKKLKTTLVMMVLVYTVSKTFTFEDTIISQQLFK